MDKKPKYSYTSRTEIENWQKCKRAFFFRKVYGGRGIVPAMRSIPLVTGSSVHKGIEILANQVLLKQPIDIKAAIQAAKADYLTAIAEKQLGDTLSEKQEWVKKEQLALATALVRVWAKVELPRLLQEYEIEQSETSLSFNLCDELNIRFMTKADMVLKNKETGEPYVYSLKTAKMWSKRSEDSYSTDLQGLTESLGIMARQREWNRHTKEQRKAVKQKYKSGLITEANALALLEQLPIGIEQVMGIRFCFLIKGPRYDLYGPDGEKLGKWTDSPFLYGYRRENPGDVEYAHSDKIWKPENKSGYGKLGKGWEKFPLFDGGEAAKSVGGVKGWIEMLANRDMQSNLDSPLDTHVITPIPRFPHREELESTLVQITSEARAAELARREWEANPTEQVLDKCFPQTRRNCFWPTDCDYVYACHKATKGQDLLDPISGIYEQRTPHHDLESEDIDGKEYE